MSRHKFTDLRSSKLVTRVGVHDDQGNPDNLIRLLSKYKQKLTSFYQLEPHEEQMFQRLRDNMILAANIAPLHDYEDVKFNGIRMIMDHTEHYLKVVDKKNKNCDIIDFYEVVKMFDIWYSFIHKHKDLTTTGNRI
jgi:phosphoglycerate-specific signal transduction histidine kinase